MQPELILDQQLIEELRHPSSDRRCGVNIVARPPAAICDQISGIQNRLRSLEPGQYYYPRSDLHLTVVEVCSGTTCSYADEAFARVCNLLPEIFYALEPSLLTNAVLRFDSRTGGVVFLDGGTLDEMRQEIIIRLAKQGITTAPRYASRSAHITFMRYLERSTCDWNRLVGSSLIQGNWQLNELWLTCGATWYGMKSRIKEVGPFKISHV